VLLILNLLAVVSVGFLVWRGGGTAGSGRGDLDRAVAAKLQAAGAVEDAAERYEAYLRNATPDAEERARIAYSLGTTALEGGDAARGLRWFYEAESLLQGETASGETAKLRDDVAAKIVHALERLGRHHAAQATLNQRVRLDGGTGDESGGEGDETLRSDDDPILAVLDGREIRRSQVERKLDDIAPQLAQVQTTPEQRAQLLQSVVADELMWRKATKLEYHRDPKVLRRHEELLRQLAIDRLIDQEVAQKIEVDEADLQNFYQAHQERYQRPADPSRKEEGEEPQTLPFDQIRPAVERDYRRSKMESAYQKFLEQELSTAEVKMFPERWDG
jgi:hypothetical protein